LLKHISDSSSHLTQRDFAGSLGISLGKTHYCLTELIKKGYVKATRFKNSRNKAAYAYVLTPQGFDEKLHLLMHFLRRKKTNTNCWSRKSPSSLRSWTHTQHNQTAKSLLKLFYCL
jgi:EPS-associated MarR family transcriptional regulator